PHRVGGCEAQIRAAPAAHPQHAEAEVGRHDLHPCICEGLAGGAGACGDIEDGLSRPGGHGLDHRSAPQPVLAHREHVVGEVVATCDVVEHGGDVLGVLLEAGATHG